MKKKIYYKLESNGDLSVTCHSLQNCNDIMESDVDDMRHEDIEGTVYTITPMYLTDKEYKALGEWEG